MGKRAIDLDEELLEPKRPLKITMEVGVTLNVDNHYVKVTIAEDRLVLEEEDMEEAEQILFSELHRKVTKRARQLKRTAQTKF